MWQSRRTSAFFLEGQADTNIAILVPQPVRELDSRGLLLCPRQIPTKVETKQRPTGLYLIPTNWEISQVKFSDVGAKGHGHTLSGVEPGFMKASILTSTNVPRALLFQDETFSKDPLVSVSYAPFLEETLAEIKDKNSTVAGVKIQIVQHIASGYKRVVSSWTSLWIKAVDFDAPFKIAVLIERFLKTPLLNRLPPLAVERYRLFARGRVAKSSEVFVDSLVGKGRCFIVLREDHPYVSEYTKEPLQSKGL